MTKFLLIQVALNFLWDEQFSLPSIDARAETLNMEH
jgi:hypothetical protein